MTDKHDQSEAERGSGPQQEGSKAGGIYEEYMQLLAGGRVSSRRSQTQSVMERNRQEQLNQMQQTQRRKKEALKKPRRKSGVPGSGEDVAGGSGALNTSMQEISGPENMEISTGPHLGRKRSKYQDAPSQMSDASGTDQPTPLLKPAGSSMQSVSSAVGGPNQPSGAERSRLKHRRDSKSARKQQQQQQQAGSASGSAGIKAAKFKSKHHHEEHGDKPVDASLHNRRKRPSGSYHHHPHLRHKSSLSGYGGANAQEEPMSSSHRSQSHFLKEAEAAETLGGIDAGADEDEQNDDAESSLMSEGQRHEAAHASNASSEQQHRHQRRTNRSRSSYQSSSSMEEDLNEGSQQDGNFDRPQSRHHKKKSQIELQKEGLLLKEQPTNEIQLNSSQVSVGAGNLNNLNKDKQSHERVNREQSVSSNEADRAGKAPPAKDFASPKVGPLNRFETPKKSVKAIDSSALKKGASGPESAAKDLVWRQIDELSSMDKVFPDPARTVGCFVQTQSTEDGKQRYGKVIECQINEESTTKVASIADHKLSIKSLNNPIMGRQKVGANTVKYLARAYLCNLAELSTEKMPAILLDALNITENSNQQVVLIQVISTKALPSATNESVQQLALQESQQSSADQHCLSEANSVHRLHVLVAKAQADLAVGEIGAFALYPAVFKPTQTRNRKTKTALSQVAPIDESERLKEIDSLCYKDSTIGKNSLQIARKIQEAFIQNYLNKVSQVKLTKENIQNHLFSIVKFCEGSKHSQKKMLQLKAENEETKREGDDVEMLSDEPNFTSAGIVTNYTIEKDSALSADQGYEIMLFVILFIGSKPGRTTAWVPLSQSQVYADLSLGLVSQKWLEKSQTHDSDPSGSGKQQNQGKSGRSGAITASPNRNLGLSSKLRQLQMLNWQESLAEKRRNLNLQETIKLKQALNNSEDESFNSELSGKQIRQAVPVSKDDTRVSNCMICHFVTSDSAFSVIECVRSRGRYHERCLQPHERYISSAEKGWRCPLFKRCSNCKSQQNQDQLMTCLKCNTPTHFDCLPKSYLKSLRPLYDEYMDKNGILVRKQNVQTRRYRCQNCIKCQNCDRQVAGTKRHHKWSKDFKLCHNCDKMREKRLFCPVCERFQPSETAEQQRALTQEMAEDAVKGVTSTQKQQSLIAIGVQMVKGEKMIKCRGCQMIVHVDCDRMLNDPIISRQIMPERVEGELVKYGANSPQYKCPNCRKTNRNALLEQIIDVLIELDKQKYFLHPFWKQLSEKAMQEYLDIIKRQPICFSTIRQDIRQSKKYLLDPANFWKDIERVFVNAKAYNDSPEIYTAAEKLHDKSNQFLKNRKLIEVVETNSKATMDEQRFTLFMRKVAKDLRKGIVPSGNNNGGADQQRPSDFKVTAKEMLQGSEMLDLRVFGVNNSVLDVLAASSGVSQDGSLMFYPGQLAAAEQLHNQAVKKNKLPAHKQWEKLMDELATNDERDTCWYPNPIKVSFEDPALMFEEMCYLCGAFGNQEDFLCCNLCGESFHPYCLPYPKSGREPFQDSWRCYNCMFCEKCHSSKQWEGLLICAVCDKVDHFWCLEPQLIQVPECNWKCPECFKCAKCGTKSFFNEKDIQNKVNLDPNEKFVFSFDFELCYQCGQDEYRKSFCSISNQKTGLGLSADQVGSGQKAIATIDSDEVLAEAGLLKCNTCGFYSYLTCSKTDMESLERHAKTFNRMIKDETGEMGTETAKSIYNCIECLMVDRLPSFYIFHQCELYESLHQSIQRQALLNSLIQTILAKYLQENVQDPELYIANFISQNQRFFREDRLIQQWLALLDSAPQPDASLAVSNTSYTEVSAVQAPLEEEKKQSEMPDSEMAEKNEEEKKAVLQAPTTSEHQLNESNATMNSDTRVSSISGIEIRDADIVPRSDYDSQELTQKQQVYQDLYGHKTGFVPLRRDLYENLLRKENNRVARQEDFFEALDDLPDKITVPTEEVVRGIDVNELFVKIELRAVLKIRILFQQWAQQLVQNTITQFSEHFSSDGAAASVVDKNAAKQSETPAKLQQQDSQYSAAEIASNNQQSDIEFCQEEDVLIDNPQKRIKCLLCGLNGERKITGRLIPFQINQFVHVNCAMWTQEVLDGQEENDTTRELYNFFFAYHEFRNYKCDFCGEPGATIFCSNRGQKRCPAAFHFPCAYSSRKVAFLQNTDIYCEQCIPKTPEAIPGFPIEFKDYPKRRIIIVRNIEPQCTMAFQNQIRKSSQAVQGATASGMPVINKSKGGPALENALSIDSNAEGGAQGGGQAQQNQQSSANMLDSQLSQQQDQQQNEGVIIACNKWRPYYYDMFNRVGNLTLLSLSRRRNSIIESLHTVNHENRNWHERFSLNFPEEEQSDFASIRIYWDYARDQQKKQKEEVKLEAVQDREEGDIQMMTAEENGQGRKKGPPKNKTYYLFANNTAQEVGRHDFTKVKKYINRRLFEYQGPAMDRLTSERQLTSINQQTRRQAIEQFWSKQITNLSIRYPQFCQDNTYMTSKVIIGLEKFPIQFWNNPGEKLGTNVAADGSNSVESKKTGLELKDLGVAGFFFKSGYKSLEVQKIPTGRKEPIGQGSSQSASYNRRGGGETNASGGTGGNQGAGASAHNPSGYQDTTNRESILSARPDGVQDGSRVITTGQPHQAVKNTSLESIFKQILEANQVNDQKPAPLIVNLAGDDKNEESDELDRKDLSTKVMNYEQIMACLGKQTLKMKKEERRKAEEELAQKEQLKQQQMQLDALYSSMYHHPQGNMPMNNPEQAKGVLASVTDAEESKDQQAQSAGTSDLMPLNSRRKGSKQSYLNEMMNKGNDINDAMKYRAAKEKPKLVEVWISKIHRNGLFALQTLQQKDIVIEYVGEKIRDPVADKREIAYTKLGVGDCYNFRLNKDYIIDATFFGSKARYINHSCEPNLISEYLTVKDNVKDETHIIFVAARKIEYGEELTFDYNFMPEMETIECFCGSEKCRGRLA